MKALKSIGEIIAVVLTLVVCIGWGLIRGYAFNWIRPIIALGGFRK
ncbi:MAG: hypothetical protein AAB394_00225 [Patescibacteria group bacterium]